MGKKKPELEAMSPEERRQRSRDLAQKRKKRRKLSKRLVKNAKVEDTAETIQAEWYKAKLQGKDKITLNTITATDNETAPEFQQAITRRMTFAALEKMAKLKFDPMEESIKIARGDLLQKDHPFLETLNQQLMKWFTVSDSLDLIDTYEIEQFRRECRKALRNSFTPLDIRSRHVIELMNYIYPKKKSIEVDVKEAIKPMVVSTLTSDEVHLFKEKFHERYET